MSRQRVLAMLAFGAASLALAPVSAQFKVAPPAGSIYKEFQRLNTGNDWRVTDPAARHTGAQAFLPNARVALSIDDLSGAVRAEALIDVWGGHLGTTNKRIRFNSNAWITVPELATTPTDGQCYMQQFNPVINIPLSHLRAGSNTIEATSGGQDPGCGLDFGWGQWAWYGIIVRVYYGSSKAHPTGSISSPGNGATIGENPTITASTSGDVSRVVFLAHFDAFDVDGDGRYADWQESYRRPQSTGGSMILPIANHVGTDTSSPFSAQWTTTLVPDQAAGAIKFQARIQGTNGVWFVTDEVSGITLDRASGGVRIYKPTNVPERFWRRDSQTAKTCTITIPSGENLSRVTQAKLLITTWNGVDGQAESGQDHAVKLNSHTFADFGKDHFYSFDVVNVPVSALRNGANTFSVFSESEHHGIEVLWPGPSLLLVSSAGGSPPPPPPDPTAPTGLVATAASSSQINLNWTDNSSSQNVTSYNVYRGSSSGFTPSATNRVGTVGSSDFADSGLSPSTTYHYKVTALNSQGESPPSSNAQATTQSGSPSPTVPSAPTGLVATTVSSSRIDLNWNDNSSTQGVTGYNVYRGTTSSFTPSSTNRIATNVASSAFQNNGLAASTQYFYKVTALNAQGESPPSAFASATTQSGSPSPTVPSAPTGLVATAVSSSRIDLNWNDNSSTQGVTGYNVYRGTTSSFTPSSTNRIASNVSSSAFQNNGLVASTEYFYKVTALNAQGESQPSAVASARTQAGSATDTVPPAIAGLAALDSFSVRVIFTETVQESSAENLDNYDLSDSQGGHGIQSAVLAADGKTVTLAVDVLSEGITYTLQATGVRDITGNPSNDSESFVLASELVAHWTFDERSGNSTSDVSGNGHDGSLSGATFDTATRDGSPSAMRFDGVDDAVDIADPIDIGGRALTLAMWFKADDFGVLDASLLSKANGLTNQYHFWSISMQYQQGVKLRFRLRTGFERTTLVAAGGALAPNVWTHVAAVYDGSFMKIYKNGVLVGSVAKTGTIATDPSVKVAIGNQPDGGGNRPFDGLIDDVRIFQTALSAAEIVALMQGGGTSPPPPPPGADTTPPNLMSADAVNSFSVRATFNESVQPLSANDPSKYTIQHSGGTVDVLSASLGGDGKTVTLSTGELTIDRNYTLKVVGVLDLATPPNSANDQEAFVLETDPTLVAHWKFDVGSGGSAADSSGNGHTGQIAGAAWDAQTADGSSNSLNFDGVDDAVDIPGFDVPGNRMTISAWIRADDFVVPDGRIISKATGVLDPDHFWMLSTINSGGSKLRFRLKAGGTTTVLIASSGNLSTGVWTHVAAVYDGAFMRLFKDGVQVGSVVKTGNINASSAVGVSIGNQPNGAGERPFDGRIDDVRVYSTALSTAQIRNLATR